MRLWLLTALQDWGYDHYDSLVVRADSEPEARRIAQNHTNESNPAHYYHAPNTRLPWIEAELSKCEPLDHDDPAAVVIGSYNAG